MLYTTLSSFKDQIYLLSSVLFFLAAAMNEALWLAYLVLKDVDVSPTYVCGAWLLLSVETVA